MQNCQLPINHEGHFNLYKCSPWLSQIGHGNKVPENCNESSMAVRADMVTASGASQNERARLAPRRLLA